MDCQWKNYFLPVPMSIDFMVMKGSSVRFDIIINNILIIDNSFSAGFGTVYIGLENAAKCLAKSLADNTVSVVQHK